jgi:hypothetical protein
MNDGVYKTPEGYLMYGDVHQAPPLQDWGLQRAKHWQLKFCWLPKRCYISGKKLWGKQAYYGERWITGPGEPIMEPYWIEKSEFLIWNLKGRQ